MVKLFIGLTIVLCASVALGQDNRGGRRHNRGGDRASASRSARRVDPTTAAFLRRVDANGNGMIDEDEVTGGAKAIVEGILTRLGIELKYPIPLSKIVSAGGDRRSGSRDDDGSRASSSEDKSSSDDSSAAPSKSGFAATKSAVPGFGRPSERPSGSESKAAAPSKSAAAAASSSPSTPAKSGRTSSGSASADSDPPADSPRRVGPKSGRFLTPQERLSKELPEWFREKDVNGDGQVDMAEFANEWTPELVDEFNRYDLNHDGIITQAECLKVMEGSHRKSK